MFKEYLVYSISITSSGSTNSTSFFGSIENLSVCLNINIESSYHRGNILRPTLGP